jgi:hypothetical protein
MLPPVAAQRPVGPVRADLSAGHELAGRATMSISLAATVNVSQSNADVR